ncbi:MAG: hypothetical protein V7711_14290 [Pseudomonadales bacterium]
MGSVIKGFKQSMSDELPTYEKLDSDAGEGENIASEKIGLQEG